MNEKQSRFVQEYLVDLNASQAALRAGYSDKTAYSHGQRLLKDVEIQAAIGKAQSERANRTEITQDRVLKELARIAFSNMGDYVRVFNGDPSVDLSNCTLDHFAAISEVTSEDYMDGRGEDSREVKKVKLKLHDKLSALNLIGKHLGMFTDRVDHTTGGQPFKALIGIDIDAI